MVRGIMVGSFFMDDDNHGFTQIWVWVLCFVVSMVFICPWIFSMDVTKYM